MIRIHSVQENVAYGSKGGIKSVRHLYVAMLNVSKSREQGGSFQQSIARGLIQFVNGEVFPAAFLLLNSFHFCRNVYREIVVDECLFGCCLEDG